MFCTNDSDQRIKPSNHMPETTKFTLITLYHYLLLATIEADDFSINKKKKKKNSTKFLIPLD